MKKRMPKSIRKFIRKEKARIRREILNLKEQEKLISELYQRFQRKSALAASPKQNIKDKQPVAPSPAKSEKRISVNQQKDQP